MSVLRTAFHQGTVTEIQSAWQSIADDEVPNMGGHQWRYPMATKILGEVNPVTGWERLGARGCQGYPYLRGQGGTPGVDQMVTPKPQTAPTGPFDTKLFQQ